jgi:hypothetical protein
VADGFDREEINSKKKPHAPGTAGPLGRWMGVSRVTCTQRSFFPSVWLKRTETSSL